MRTVLRGVAVWLCIILVEMLHGIARTMFLAPAIGDFRARQVAVFTGSLLNLFRGGLLPIGLLVLTAAPLIAARFRQVL
jgi:hypothetical protein